MGKLASATEPECVQVPSSVHGTKPTESEADNAEKNITMKAAKKTRLGGFCAFFS
jgi:hypothetical protein